MHSSKEQQSNHTSGGDSIFGLVASSFLGPVGEIWQAAEAASAIYTDRFETAAKKADNRTNGHEGGYKLGVKNSLGGSFGRAHENAIESKNIFDMNLPYWKRDAAPAPRRAA